MRIVTENQYNTIYPINNSEYFASMDETHKKAYLEMYTLYRIALNQYVYVLGLKEAEEALANSNLNFLKTKDEDKDIYQATSPLGYYYVRNNTYIERLPQDQLDNFRKHFVESGYKIDKETMNFIATTFKETIRENKDQKLAYNYGPSSSTYMADDESLILGFRYDEFNLNGMTDDVWDANNDKQWAILEQINPQMEQLLSSKTGMPVKVIQYDEYSIGQNQEEKVK